MSADNNVTPIRPGASAPDPFDDLYDRMQAQLDALHCVVRTMERSDWETDEDLCAALALLRRTYGKLDALHADFATWHTGTSAQKEVQS
jgi:hypothetical protein